ncbi:hypothetical protein RB195_019746 [Necator americanus]|uniref:Uncharacterized protein n=1 Tax=Necator americanus TaxID=51031 RepID=A0ABR1CI47_NECAM
MLLKSTFFNTHILVFVQAEVQQSSAPQQSFSNSEHYIEQFLWSGQNDMEDPELQRVCSKWCGGAQRLGSIRDPCQHQSAIVEDDPLETTGEVGQGLGIQQSSTIWKEIGMVKKLNNKNHPFLDRIVTCNEKWILCGNRKHPSQLMDKDEAPKHFLKPKMHPKKTMTVIVWWCAAGNPLQPHETWATDVDPYTFCMSNSSLSSLSESEHDK